MGYTINAAGLRLIESFEGLRLTAYRDQRLIWSVGYGSTSNVRPGMVITKAEAELRLRADLAEAEGAVSRLVRIELTDNQASALIALVYNIGSGAFSASTMLRLLNGAQFELAAGEFLKWNRVNGRPDDGLTRRRQAERSLFLTPVGPA